MTINDCPRMTAAVRDARGIEEGCALEIENNALRAQLAGVVEQAWLVESVDARWGTGYFFTGLGEYEQWGVIENAVRFKRKEDAEQIIASLNKQDGKYARQSRYEACEHMWPGLADLPAAPTGETK